MQETTSGYTKMKPTPKQDQLATFFIALGHRRRQMLCEILAAIGPKGISFGRLQSRSGLTSPTLAHHLNFMEKGGILRRTPKGRETWVALDFSTLAISANMFAQHITRKRKHLS